MFQKLKIKSFPKLDGLHKVEEFSVSDCLELKDLNGLSSVRSIRNDKNRGERKLLFKGCQSLEDINGVLHLDISKHWYGFIRIPESIEANKITKLILPNIESTKGIIQFPNLEYLDLTEAKIFNLHEVGKLKKLKLLNLNKCTQLETLDGLEELTQIDQLIITKTSALRDISALSNITIGTLYIADSLLKKADFPAHLQDCIDWQKAFYNDF
jgi:hypothetical protein